MISSESSENVSSEVGLLSTETGPRNIPNVNFIENIEEFLRERKIDEVIEALRQLHGKFKYMESSLMAQKKSLVDKLPDLRDAIESVEVLKKRKERATSFQTHFVLSDNVLAKAEVPPTESVFLWLGANILLEYPLDEAEVMLNQNKTNTETVIKEINSGLEHLRTQLTTTEVNISRIHNYGVTLRRQQNSAVGVVEA